MSTGLILQMFTILSGFILPKIILTSFGSEVNGLVSSLNQFLSYISLVEGGITGVVMANLYKPIVEKDEQKISAQEGFDVDSKDATKVTFTTFAGLTDGKTYDVTLDGTTKQVPVSNGKVASVNVNTLTVPVATETEIKLVSKDANGVVLDEYAYDPSSSSYSSKYDFSLTTNNGYVNGSKIY